MLSAVLLLVAAAAQPTVEQDARCLATMATIVGVSSDPQAKQGGLLGTMLWYGRLSARLSEDEIKAAIKQEAARMTAADLGAEAKRCGGEMAAYGAALRALGAEMKSETPPKAPDPK